MKPKFIVLFLLSAWLLACKKNNIVANDNEQAQLPVMAMGYPFSLFIMPDFTLWGCGNFGCYDTLAYYKVCDNNRFAGLVFYQAGNKKKLKRSN
jgi:hypothetical protein